jgi:hypothetical protein
VKTDTTTLDREDAERQARAANKRLNEIRDAERYAENKDLLGKTFKFENNYSCPEKPSDYWWQYSKVQAVDGAGYLSVFFFETDKNGGVTIRTEHRFHMEHYTPCSKAQFDKAWCALQHKISKTKP